MREAVLYSAADQVCFNSLSMVFGNKSLRLLKRQLISKKSITPVNEELQFGKFDDRTPFRFSFGLCCRAVPLVSLGNAYCD